MLDTKCAFHFSLQLLFETFFCSDVWLVSVGVRAQTKAMSSWKISIILVRFEPKLGLCWQIFKLWHISSDIHSANIELPITVVARSKASTVFAHTNAVIVGSNPTQGMDVCMRLFCVCVVLCVGSGLATGWSSVQGVLPTVYRIKKLK
jgi:hypothetical protein